MRRKWKYIIPVLALLGTCLLFRFVLFIGYIPTESMEPTLKKGSVIVGSRPLGKLDVGDIIVFRHEGKLLVKRIAAKEGDKVEHNQRLLRVPAGKLYVLGDNRGCSSDSRWWEEPFININSVIAIVLENKSMPLPR